MPEGLLDSDDEDAEAVRLDERDESEGDPSHVKTAAQRQRHTPRGVVCMAPLHLDLALDQDQDQDPFQNSRGERSFVYFDTAGWLTVASLPPRPKPVHEVLDPTAPIIPDPEMRDEEEVTITDTTTTTDSSASVKTEEVNEDTNSDDESDTKQQTSNSSSSSSSGGKSNRELKVVEAQENVVDEEDEDEDAGVALRVHYDGNMAVRFVPVGHSIRFVCHHRAHGLVVLLLVKPKVVYSMEETTDRSLPVYEDSYEVVAYDSRTWKVVCRYKRFEEHEAVLCMRSVTLFGSEYIVLGTSNFQGEDVSCKGRMILLDLVPSADFSNHTHTTKWKIHAYDQREKGPVTHLSEVDDMVLLCIGPRMIFYKFEKPNFVGKAFYDCEFYVVSVKVIKNFIVFADVQKSVYLIIWDPITKLITLLAKDYELLKCYGVDFMLDGAQLAVLVSDANKNVQIFRYLPNRRECLVGKRLLARGDFHMGAHVVSWVPLKTRALPSVPLPHNAPDANEDPYVTARRERTSQIRSLNIGGTLDGGYSFFFPIPAKIYSRLHALHIQMTFNLPHIAGLNPFAYRLFRPETASHVANRKNVVDGELIWQYLHLDRVQQQELARHVGSSPEQIIDNLRELDLTTRLF